jgi:hypothetical protein
MADLQAPQHCRNLHLPLEGGGRRAKARREEVRARAARCETLHRSSPHPASLRGATLPLQGRVKQLRSRSAPSRASWQTPPCNLSLARPRGGSSLIPSLRSGLYVVQSEYEVKEAERRQTLIIILRILRCGPRLARRARLSAFRHGSLARRLWSPGFGSRPGFLGRGRYFEAIR